MKTESEIVWGLEIYIPMTYMSNVQCIVKEVWNRLKCARDMNALNKSQDYMKIEI